MKNSRLYAFLSILLLPTLSLAHEISNKSYDDLGLYPLSTPYAEGYLKVSQLHSVYYAQFGNPQGFPVVVVHGGPGGGCSDTWSQFFDLDIYRVIMFDQRGAHRSMPFAEMEDNTPQRSVEDMESLRIHLEIDKWLIFGGSWGSTLAIYYGETHPERALGFVLRGIFTGQQHEYEHLFYGMQKTFPEAWEEMLQAIPPAERNDLITAFYIRVMHPDPAVHLPAAHAFMRYDTICGSLLPSPELVESIARDDRSALGVARAFLHYSVNRFFFTPRQLLEDLPKISHLPCIIVQGRYDIICPPCNAFNLYREWQSANLWFITDAGHFSDEPSLARGLREALDAFKLQKPMKDGSS